MLRWSINDNVYIVKDLDFNNYSSMDVKAKHLDPHLRDIYEKVWKRRENIMDKESIKKDLSAEEEAEIVNDPETAEVLAARKKRIKETIERYKNMPEIPKKKVKPKKFFLNNAHAKDYYERNPNEKEDEE